MEFKHKDNGEKGSFVLKDNGENAGEITYIWVDDDNIIIDHTGVRGKYEGQGIGKKLVDAVAEMARERNLKIMPLCPFAKALFARSSEYSDVKVNIKQ
jgi:predicted GNAT family acetyltransferase